jgi:hypothetical protein
MVTAMKDTIALDIQMITRELVIIQSITDIIMMVQKHAAEGDIIMGIMDTATIIREEAQLTVKNIRGMDMVVSAEAGTIPIMKARSEIIEAMTMIMEEPEIISNRTIIPQTIGPTETILTKIIHTIQISSATDGMM